MKLRSNAGLLTNVSALGANSACDMLAIGDSAGHLRLLHVASLQLDSQAAAEASYRQVELGTVPLCSTLPYSKVVNVL